MSDCVTSGPLAAGSLTALGAIRLFASELKKHNIPEPGHEAEAILTFGLGIDKVRLLRDDPVLTEAEARRAKEILQRRIKREPLQYILGSVEFCGMEISVGPGALVPRPETEFLVQELIQRGQGLKAPVVLDLCTGSGCIAVAAGKELPKAKVIGVDVSGAALLYARKNASLPGLENVSFLEGDLFGPVSGMRFDLIASNPPYVRGRDMDGLQPEVRDWEPTEALDGGPDGLDFLRRIVSGCARHLMPGGIVILEVGEGQAQEVSGMALAFGLKTLLIIADYGGHERVLVLGERDNPS